MCQLSCHLPHAVCLCTVVERATFSLVRCFTPMHYLPGLEAAPSARQANRGGGTGQLEGTSVGSDSDSDDSAGIGYDPDDC